jgi:hypothetical protein
MAPQQTDVATADTQSVLQLAGIHEVLPGYPGMRQNRARDAAPTPRAAWLARQGQSAAQSGSAPGAAS